MRSVLQWRKLWSVWTVSAVASGVLLDTAAYTFAGPECTLTANIQRWTHVQPRGKYCSAGRAGLFGFFIWCILHLAYGLLNPLPVGWSPLLPAKDKTE